MKSNVKRYSHLFSIIAVKLAEDNESSSLSYWSQQENHLTKIIFNYRKKKISHFLRTTTSCHAPLRVWHLLGNFLWWILRSPKIRLEKGAILELSKFKIVVLLSDLFDGAVTFLVIRGERGSISIHLTYSEKDNAARISSVSRMSFWLRFLFWWNKMNCHIWVKEINRRDTSLRPPKRCSWKAIYYTLEERDFWANEEGGVREQQ